MNYNNQNAYYINKPYYQNQMKQNEGERFFFAAPFLVGAIAGGAVASVARPRPVYVTPQQPYAPNMPYANTSYSYYYPVYK